MFGGHWEIKCIKDYNPHSCVSQVPFKVGEIYRVKDKFPDGPNMSVEEGIWEVNSHGSLYNIDFATRQEHFVFV